MIVENVSIPLFPGHLLFGHANEEYLPEVPGLFVLCFLFNILAESVRLKIYNINKMDAKAEQVKICKQGQPKSIHHAPNSIFSIGCIDILWIKTRTI